MPAREPKLTVAIPVFNGERYLPDLFACLCAQSFPHFDIVIVDNASTDRTGELCRAFAAQDRRVRYYRNERNIGAAPNFNRAFQLRRGCYFKWAAYDDILAPEYLARCVDALDDDPSAVLCHSGVILAGPDLQPMLHEAGSGRYLDHEGNPLVPGEGSGLAQSPDPVRRFADVLHRAFLCTEIFGVIRAETLACTSLHRSYYGSDKVLLTELALAGRFARVPEPLFTRRVHQRTTLYFSARERDAWIDPDIRHRVPQLRVLDGYVRAVLRAELNASQRLRALSHIIRKLARLEVAKKLLLPGPESYFGVEGRKKS